MQVKNWQAPRKNKKQEKSQSSAPKKARRNAKRLAMLKRKLRNETI